MRPLGSRGLKFGAWIAQNLGRFGLALLVGAVVTGFAVLWLDAPQFADFSPEPASRAIERERARRHALYAAHQPLTGTPDLSALNERLKAKGFKLGSPVFVRIFKEEFELEVWLKRDGRFEHFATYPICRWSGGLGPKLSEGDRQAPEGFYAVDRSLLNAKSHWHRAFNLGFPNLYDAARARTGSVVMVHGGCSSAGCIAMTNEVIDEIWKIVLAALNARQPRFAVHVLPFRLTDANLIRHAGSPWAPFWRELAAVEGLFEATLLPPAVSVCRGHYTASSAKSGSDGSTALLEDCSPHLLDPIPLQATTVSSSADRP